MKNRNQLRRQRAKWREADEKRRTYLKKHCFSSYGGYHLPTGPGPHGWDGEECHWCKRDIYRNELTDANMFEQQPWRAVSFKILEWI